MPKQNIDKSVNQEKFDQNQQWLVQAIALDDELIARQEKLKSEMLDAEKLHLKDLFSWAEKVNLHTQIQLERAQKQNQRLQQQLQEAKQELKEYRQELIATNEALVDALKWECLTPDQAKKIAKALLAENEPSRETVVRLLNIIYGSDFKPWELGHPQHFHPNPDAVKCSDSPSRWIQRSPESAHFKARFDQLKAQFVALKSQLVRLPIQHTEASKIYKSCIEQYRGFSQ